MIHLRNFAVYIVIEASETSTNLEGSPMVSFTAMMQTYRNIQHLYNVFNYFVHASGFK